ncbi:hypothetical protein Tco_0439336 [Tanacetum coccineum]
MFLIVVVLAMFPPYHKVYLVGHTGNHLWVLYSLHSTPSTLFTGRGICRHYKCGFNGYNDYILATILKVENTSQSQGYIEQEARNTAAMEQATTTS